MRQRDYHNTIAFLETTIQDSLAANEKLEQKEKTLVEEVTSM